MNIVINRDENDELNAVVYYSMYFVDHLYQSSRWFYRTIV